MSAPIDIYIELLDEGTQTWRAIQAMPLANGLFQLLKPEDYDPEDELWPFLPGAEVRLVEETDYRGRKGWVAKHPDPKAVEILVESTESYAPQNRETHAMPVGNGLYEVQATPHYTPAQLWKFPPGSIVRLKPMETAFPGWKPLVAVAP